MNRKHFLAGIALALCLTISVVVFTLSAPAIDPSRKTSPSWSKTELYCAIGLVGADTAAEEETRWQDFLQHVVTPRFPDGYTVIDAYGQWRNSSTSETLRERTKILLILHENTSRQIAAIEEIRSAWKVTARQQSVLLVRSSPVEVSF